MFDSSDRNRPFADQLADSLSPDPARISACGTNLADSMSQSFANSITGNHPGADRFTCDTGSFADQLTQDWMDEVL